MRTDSLQTGTVVHTCVSDDGLDLELVGNYRQPDLKMGGGYEQTSLQRRYANGR